MKCEMFRSKEATTMLALSGSRSSAEYLCDGCKRAAFDRIGTQPCNTIILPSDHKDAARIHSEWNRK